MPLSFRPGEAFQFDWSEDFPDLATLNAWLEQRCQDLWRETADGTLPGTIADVWPKEQAALMPLPVAFA